MIDRADVIAMFSQRLKTLAQEGADLVKADASPAEIADQDAIAADLKAAMDGFILASMKRTDEQKRHDDWQTVLAECGTAKEKYEAAASAVKKQIEELFTAEDALARSQRRLNDHLLAEPNTTVYPSSAVVRRWNIEKVRLETEVQERQKNVRDIRQRDPEIARAFQAAKRHFEQLTFGEMQLRPKQEFPRVVPTDWRVVHGRELTGVR